MTTMTTKMKKNIKTKEEAEDLLNNREKLLDAAQFLKESGVSNRLKLESFKDSFGQVTYKG